MGGVGDGAAATSCCPRTARATSTTSTARCVEGKPLKIRLPRRTLATSTRKRRTRRRPRRRPRCYARGRAAVHRRHHRRAGRPDDDGAGRSRDAARDAGAEGARDRHPPDPRDAASQRERHHRSHQGELPEPDRVPRRVARSTAARFSTGTAPRRCSATATCCSCRRARASRAAPGRVHRDRGHREADGLVRERGSRKPAGAASGAPEDDILEVMRAQEAEATRKARPIGRRGAGRALPRGRRGLHPEPGRIHVAAAAPAEDRLRPRGADHRPAARGRDPRPVRTARGAARS